MRSFVYVGCIVACALGSGCQRGSDVQVPLGWLQYEEVRKVTGTVRFLNVEGGCWALDICDRRLEPINLDDSYKVDGLPVIATVRAENDKISICMIGQFVSVLDIHKR